MHPGLFLDQLHVITSLWGALTGPAVCAAQRNGLSNAVREVTEVPALPAPIEAVAFINVNVVPMNTERVLVPRVRGGIRPMIAPPAVFPPSRLDSEDPDTVLLQLRREQGQAAMEHLERLGALVDSLESALQSKEGLSSDGPWRRSETMI